MLKTLKKSWLSLVAILSVAALPLVGCGSNSNAAPGSSSSGNGQKEVTVKVGVSGSDTRIWDFIENKAEKEGIHIQVVKFSDYVLPNMALAQGELDMNAFQNIAYLNTFKKQHNLDISPLATTVLAPMALYSKKYKTLQDIPDGAKIAIPNDLTNQARALMLLQSGGLIKLAPDFGLKGTPKQIIDNPKHLNIVPMVAAQTPRVLPDVAASVINNGIAVDAKLNPLKDSILHEGATAKPYLNILAVRTKDLNRPELKEIAKLYQSDDVKKFILDTWQGGQIPEFIPVSEIANIGA